jgi:hypothetical protein
MLFGDCDNVVKAGGASPFARMHKKCMYAGLAKNNIIEGSNRFVMCDLKVKAHLKDAQAKTDWHLFCIKANRLADEYAKDALGWNEVQTCDVAFEKGKIARAARVAKVLTATCKLWPNIPKADVKEDIVLRATGGRNDPRRVTHTWEQRQFHDAWICTTCLTTAKNGGPFMRRKFEQCRGASRNVLSVVTDPQQHNLHTTTDDAGELLLVCTRCGCYTTGKPDNLKRRCQGRPSTGGRQALKRNDRNLSPSTQGGPNVGKLVPVTEEMRREASRQLDVYLAGAFARA